MHLPYTHMQDIVHLSSYSLFKLCTYLVVKDLIRRILNPNIQRRLDTLDMLSHTWNSHYPASIPAPIYAEAKHTIERCFNPPLAAHIYSMLGSPLAQMQMQPPRLPPLQTPAVMTGLATKRFADVIHYPYRHF